MFSAEKKTVQTPTTDINRIAAHTHIVGDLTSEGDFRIDGSVDGTVKTSGKVIIGKQGSIKGTVECQNADIEGKLSGTLQVSEMLVLKSTADVSGEVTIGKLTVEPGASFNVSCNMKGAVKNLNKSEEKRKQQGQTA